MSETDLYDDLIMDHIRNARNHRALDQSDRKATGSNPLCGDEVTVYLKIERGRIEDVTFQCTCCGISMASASIMTELTKGKDATEVRNLLRAFVAMLAGRADWETNGATREQRAIFAAAQRFPARARCALLPWATLEGALDGRQEAVFVR
jgi:nitrogen fixation NifU-like protein